MNYNFWMPIVLLLILIGGIYFGKRIKNLIKIKNKYLKILYWIVIYILFTITILLKNKFSVFIFYSLILYGISDITYLIIKKLKLSKLIDILKKIYLRGIIVLIISFFLTLYGIYNVNNIVIKNYDIKSTKQMSNSYNIVVLSDLHLGTIKNEKILENMKDKVNIMNPDIFILAGDIFDENTSDEYKANFFKILEKIKTKYGIYYVEGNHDLLTNNIKKQYIDSNVTVLDDKSTLINNDFYLVGRLDYRRVKYGTGRKTLNNLCSSLNKKYPIILIDHQPRTEELKNYNVDLQLSGHTHNGQFFPGNLFLKNGYYENKNYKLIVSSGYGVWAFEARTAGHNELVNINYHS